MNELQISNKEFRQKRELALMLRSGGKSIDIRRKMVGVPEVERALTKIEMYVFLASTKTQISDIEDSILIEKTAKLLKFIAKDIGYTITDTREWSYTCTRIMDLMRKYLSNNTLSDIKLAFELLITGELNSYIPEGDRKHYQKFNASYFISVMNAYKSYANQVLNKAYAAIPTTRELYDSRRESYRNQTAKLCAITYLKFKYTGKLILGLVDDLLIYNWLHRVGLANDIAELEEDRREALGRYLSQVRTGFVNKYTAEHVRRKGINSQEINYTSYEIARKKEIRRSFERMVKDEIYIYNYLTFEL